MKYEVTIRWQAHGSYTTTVHADSEAEAIELAKEEDDDDLWAQMGDYSVTDCDAEPQGCETCDGTGEVSNGHYADPNTETYACPDCNYDDPDKHRP